MKVYYIMNAIKTMEDAKQELRKNQIQIQSNLNPSEPFICKRLQSDIDRLKKSVEEIELGVK